MTRFSQLYLRPTALSPDSRRMRVRLGALARKYVDHGERWKAGQFIEAEQGIQVGGDWAHIFENLELRDVLDAVTSLYKWLEAEATRHVKAYVRQPVDRSKYEGWFRDVKRVFEEECVSYCLDHQCGVQLSVDELFERDRAATLAGLQADRYASARREFEEGFKDLVANPPNGKAAIRNVFMAVETVFKLMFSRAPRLGAKEIRDHLKANVAGTYAENSTSLRSMEKATESFLEWVEAAHWYRHAQGEEEPTEPPLETTVLLISQGSAFLRWLMTLDAAEQARSGARKPER